MKTLISVSELSSYLYCPRKLYLSSIIKIPLPPKDVLIKGEIKHSVFDKLNSIEKEIIENIQKPIEPEKLNGIYEQNFKSIFIKTLDKYQKQIKAFNIDEKEFFQHAWPIFQIEAFQRAEFLSNFILKTNLLGSELWNSLEPKFQTELKIKSEALKLVGKIDKVEIYSDKIIPVEIKSGKAPRTGFWQSNKIQLIAYCFLAKEHFSKPVNHGFVHYIDCNEKRLLTLNPFSEIELFSVRDNIFKMLDAKIQPEILKNNKCNSCNIKEQCFGFKA